MEKPKREYLKASPALLWLRSATGMQLEDKTSKGLTKCAIAYITHLGGYATQIDTNGRYVPALQKYVPSNSEPGTADVHACLKGRHLSIEIKAGNDRMKPDQYKCAKKVRDAGGYYLVIRSFQDLYQFIEERRRK